MKETLFSIFALAFSFGAFLVVVCNWPIYTLIGTVPATFILILVTLYVVYRVKR